ncbi:GNAT family N-acetyltransferase [Virgisporangium aurantiacum]|uniref:N-acetyltransferase n=1 Tax=Virgisporangium aurantiacum TaxID=175570 RepID=A0A8J3ZD00_9ACTN|nr:GNAT family N-acetyltransferase [Virgisporangium aurantiacum]GIJ59505.1 N-acetyltransferase [Virgisporangium aurantiacum]
MIRYEWRGEFTNDALNRLHADGFGHRLLDDDWWGQVNRHSLGWVVAYDGDELVGFVNVPWDGAIHAFIIDTLTAVRLQRQGIATELVAIAARESSKAGCEWLHVDFEDHLAGFYFEACGFEPTQAGLIALQ